PPRPGVHHQVTPALPGHPGPGVPPPRHPGVHHRVTRPGALPGSPAVLGIPRPDPGPHRTARPAPRLAGGRPGPATSAAAVRRAPVAREIQMPGEIPDNRLISG